MLKCSKCLTLFGRKDRILSLCVSKLGIKHITSKVVEERLWHKKYLCSG